MITIISSSNRSGNYTELFAQKCKELLDIKGVENKLFFLDQIPSPIDLQSIYDYENSAFAAIAKEVVEPADKFLFVIPEYNGSLPGILKFFIDGIHPKYFTGKKAAFIGVSAGRAGNLRGMDHLQDVLHYLEVVIMPPKLPISQLFKLIKENQIVDKETLELLEKQVEDLIYF